MRKPWILSADPDEEEDTSGAADDDNEATSPEDFPEDDHAGRQ